MKVEARDLGKKFGKTWLFRHLDFSFEAPNKYAIIGPNASGKSSLLRLIAGFSEASEGELQHTQNNQLVDELEWFRHLSIASPILELELLFSLREYLELYSKMKPFRNAPNLEELARDFGLEDSLDKELGDFSSGMMQRLRIGLAMAADTDLVLLDEPLSNLDAKAAKWYENYVTSQMGKRLIIVFSNAKKQEYTFCTEHLNIEELKSS